jgi:transglutaminase-like putative cysteine protease
MLRSVSQFLVLLQIIKLYEARANRDYAQLLILSWLLMVAACIQSTTLIFGIVMALYLVLALYGALLFHLKVEADKASAAFAIPRDKLPPGTLRQDQRYLSRSMRRFTGLVTAVSLTTAVVVFVFFPRGAGAGVLGQLQFKRSDALAGMNERVSLEQINKIRQNAEVVAQVTVTRDGKLVEGTETLLLRMVTHDTYGGDVNRGRPQWARSSNPRMTPTEDRDVSDDALFRIAPADPKLPLYHQRVLMRETSSRYLFALQQPVSLEVGRTIHIQYFGNDQVFFTNLNNMPLDYDVMSQAVPARRAVPEAIARQATFYIPESDPAVLAQVRQYAVKILGEEAANRAEMRGIEEDNEEIARKIERHLQDEFSYTLDLTDSKKAFEGKDPVVAFLNDVKKGHCEYFASAMTLMCQSLNIPARMVVGFKCDEYNPVGGYYVVRQAHAHSWVEVLTARGWVQFDPTSGREAPGRGSSAWLRPLQHFFDYLEYKWATYVVSYENHNRQEILSELEDWSMTAAYRVGDFLRSARESPEDLTSFLAEPKFWTSASAVIVVLIVLMSLAIVGIVASYLIQQRRLRRRAARIGLDHLPVDEQLRLARQLAFYDQLNRTLHRHQIFRPAYQTPMEFANSLVFLPGEVYDTVRRLTAMLYRVRFGQATLDGEKQRRLSRVVGRLTETLDGLRARPI